MTDQESSPDSELDATVEEIVEQYERERAEAEAGYKNLQREATNFLVDKVKDELEESYPPIQIKRRVEEELND